MQTVMLPNVQTFHCVACNVESDTVFLHGCESLLLLALYINGQVHDDPSDAEAKSIWCGGTGYLTLKIEHPHDKGWQLLQATFLPERIGEDIANMQRHELPCALAAKVQCTDTQTLGLIVFQLEYASECVAQGASGVGL